MQNPTLSSWLPFCVKCCEEKYRRQDFAEYTKAVGTVQEMLGQLVSVSHYPGQTLSPRKKFNSRQ